jgi:hypothetical protein
MAGRLSSTDVITDTHPQDVGIFVAPMEKTQGVHIIAASDNYRDYYRPEGSSQAWPRWIAFFGRCVCVFAFTFKVVSSPATDVCLTSDLVTIYLFLLVYIRHRQSIYLSYSGSH